MIISTENHPRYHDNMAHILSRLYALIKVWKSNFMEPRPSVIEIRRNARKNETETEWINRESQTTVYVPTEFLVYIISLLGTIATRFSETAKCVRNTITVEVICAALLPR